MSLDLLFLFLMLMLHFYALCCRFMWWVLFWCWRVLGLGGHWAAVNGSRPGTQMSPGHYDIINSWTVWACGFCILLYYSITPTKERFCICYDILIKIGWRWFAWVTPPGRTKLSHCAFSHFPHLFATYCALTYGWKRDAYKRSQDREISISPASLFSCTGTQSNPCGLFLTPYLLWVSWGTSIGPSR